MSRPVLIGMNNPHSERPEAALLPHPRGCAGWRLWRMVSDVCGVSRARWCRLTERVNLLDSTLWDPLAAAARGETLWKTLEDRTVVVLGVSARSALRLDPTPALLWSASRGVRWCWVPHPSGLCREYNDPLVRHVVGLRMEELLERAETTCHRPVLGV